MELDADAIEPEDGNSNFKQLLLRRQQEARITLQTTKDNGAAPVSDSNFAFHMADVGTDAMEREKSFYFAQRSSRTSAECTEALDRINGGKYGICGDCGKHISKERLEVLPEARLCVQCKKKLEA